MTDREIIETLAVKVMGWKILPAIGVGPGTEDMVKFERPDACNIYWWPKCEGVDRGWNPLASISDAFQVVDGMRQKIGLVLTLHQITSGFLASFNNIHASRLRSFSEDLSPSRAICLAAIAAECAGGGS